MNYSHTQEAAQDARQMEENSILCNSVEEGIANRIEELKSIALDALEELNAISGGNIIYDNRLHRFIEL